MTVGELKQRLSEFDDDLEIGGSGHFGEVLEIWGVHKSVRGFVRLDVESSGEEPD